ncbi:MAG: CvpA family protein [Verrucomicrobiota bacterium]
MTIWLLALVLMASLAGLGYRQGGVRVAFSLVGILLGALLAGPLGKLPKPILVVLGLKNPTLPWLLGPLIIFVLISIIFKVAALMVHQKVDVHYKYHTGDLRLVLWERLNHRIGLCLGLVNGALYCILISLVIYPFSYWTVQMATSDNDPRSVRILNAMGRDLQSTGFAKVAQALNPMPQVWYDAADFTGLIYNNPLSEARLARYPGFFGLAERPEIQDMASDNQFTEMRQRREPIMNVIDHPKTQAILNNPDLLRLIWATVVPDMKDFMAYLQTGKSPKYDSEKILGRWNFDVNVALAMVLRTKPNISSREMMRQKEWMLAAYSKTSFLAKTDHQATLKNVPQVRAAAPGAAPGFALQTMQGTWKNLDGKYQITVSTGSKDADMATVVEGDRLTITGEGMNLVFNRED